MSTGLNCEYIEGKPGMFYLILERGNAPKVAWDWRENAECFGSFCSFKACGTFLYAHFANPGGHCESPYEARFEKDEVLQRLLASARKTRFPENWRIHEFGFR